MLPPHRLSMRGLTIHYQGPPLEDGPLPAVLYFALSGKMSLFSDPFNQPVLPLCRAGIRVFSWDLPFHAEDADPQEAMDRWSHEFSLGSTFIADFIASSQQIIADLINQGYIKPMHLGGAGLSRGGYIALQLAASMSQIHPILGFAPLTHPRMQNEKLALTALADRLIHTPIRCYIGNRDIRVGTDACYTFIRTITETAFAQGIRSPAAELILFPSIGHKGHGTPPYIFKEGAEWMIQQLSHRRPA